MSPRRAKAVADKRGVDPGAALREHLVDAAQRLVETEAVASITTRQIAAAAGVSEGVLYNYFADKNDLIVAALVRRFGEVAMRFEARLPAAGASTVEDNLTSLAVGAQAMQDDLLPLVVGLLNERELLGRFIDATHREPLMPRHRIADYLAQEQRLGRVPATVDVSAVTTLLMGAMFMTALGRNLAPERAQAMPAERVRAIVTALTQGFGPRTERADDR
jgi:AcrR family transcriptional regulator